MLKIPEISVGSQTEMFVSVPSDREVGKFLGLVGPFEFDKPVRLPTSLHLPGEFGKGIKNG